MEHQGKKIILHWQRRGTLDIAPASGTEGPGSNPAKVYIRFLGRTKTQETREIIL
jgi:hypothetical protein